MKFVVGWAILAPGGVGFDCCKSQFYDYKNFMIVSRQPLRNHVDCIRSLETTMLKIQSKLFIAAASLPKGT